MNRVKEEEKAQRQRDGVKSQGCCHGTWYCGYKLDCYQGDRLVKGTILYPLGLILHYLKLSSMTMWEKRGKKQNSDEKYSM